jgi:hypothetical protein
MSPTSQRIQEIFQRVQNINIDTANFIFALQGFFRGKVHQRTKEGRLCGGTFQVTHVETGDKDTTWTYVWTVSLRCDACGETKKERLSWEDLDLSGE